MQRHDGTQNSIERHRLHLDSMIHGGLQCVAWSSTDQL